MGGKAVLSVEAPSIPSATDLSSLPQPVAILLLIAVILTIAGFYTSPLVKHWLSRSDKDEGSAKHHDDRAVTAATPPSITPLVDRTATVTDDYISSLKEERTYLRDQLAAAARELESREREWGRQLSDAQREISRLNDLLQREREWRRPS